MALSNKDFIGETLGVELTERLDGTLAATALAAADGRECSVCTRLVPPGGFWRWSPRSGHPPAGPDRTGLA